MVKRPLNKKLLFVCKGRQQLSRRVWVRDSWTIPNKKMERVLIFLCHWEGEVKEMRKRDEKVSNRAGDRSLSCKMPSCFWKTVVANILFYVSLLTATWTSPFPHTSVKSVTHMPLMSGLRWKARKSTKSWWVTAVQHGGREAIPKPSKLEEARAESQK